MQIDIIANNNTLPVRNVKDGLTQLYVSTLGEFTDIEQIAETIITTVDGKPIRVRDIATVEDSYGDINRVVSINDQPMIRLGMRKECGANTVEVCRLLQQQVERIDMEREALNLGVVMGQSD